MPTTLIDGIETYYETIGSGPPLLMFAPGGFNATIENWRELGIYQRTALFGHLTNDHTCIAFDRRESGRSGGRLERISWRHYAEQGLGLLDHLGVARAAVIGGCVGCSVALSLAVDHPGRVSRLVLYSPAGGVRYRVTQHQRLTRHLAFASEHGLPAVVQLAKDTTTTFSKDARVGPWASVLRADETFADTFLRLDPEHYQLLVTGMARVLFDRDTVPGPEPEDLLRLDIPALVVPGQDASHATSAARYLQECLPAAQYWDIAVADQTEQVVSPRIARFLAGC
ncbi:alpha/beta hydrolase [Mycobacterium intracellulare]|uniref:alpha/beta fold hydrolase n=1 Tax=Mycobacterium intracellulare TaxID=1767 RepID=UPI0033486C94